MGIDCGVLGCVGGHGRPGAYMVFGAFQNSTLVAAFQALGGGLFGLCHLDEIQWSGLFVGHAQGKVCAGLELDIIKLPLTQ